MPKTDNPASAKLSKFKVEQEEKRVRQLVRSVARTPEGRLAFRNVTGISFSDDVDRTELPIVRLLVPTYRGVRPQVNNALEQMIAVCRGVCVVAPEPSTSSSIVHWSRNGMLAELYKSGRPFDHVLFMDDDIVPPPDALVKLLGAKKDIIAAACTVRQDPPLPNFRTYNPVKMNYTTAFQWTGDGVIDIGAVGTGFMLISRKALDAVADYYIRCEYEKRYLLAPMIEDQDGIPVSFGAFNEAALPDWLRSNLANLSFLRNRRAEETKNGWWFENLKQPFGDGEYGEDVSFCFKARECGFPVYVDTSVRPGHIGQYPYGIEDYLHYQKDVVGDLVPVGQRVTDEVSALMEEVSEPCPA